MKRLLILLHLLIGFVAYGQETLSPLTFNPRLYYSSPQYKQSLHQSRSDAILQKHNLLIESDTLPLPFVDDFSYNTLKPLNFYPYIYQSIYLAFGPCDSFMQVDTSVGLYSMSQSYSYSFDAGAQKLDSTATLPIVFHYFPLTGSDCFDHMADSLTVYPAQYRIVFDSTTGNVRSRNLDTTFRDTLISYAYVIFKCKMPGYVKWIDNFADHNYNFPYLPPTLGVATLDGLNEYGRPYNNSTPSIVGYADTLTTKPLDLSPYTDADSVYLSFFYEPRGYGDYPNTGDSLFLEFYNGYTSAWDNVWGVDGFQVAPAWPDTFKQVMIRIPSTIAPYQQYFFKGFQFRFRNIASLAGNNDHWHIDYVRLAKNRSVTDTSINDIAFQYPMPSILKNYTEMPAWQYKGSGDLSDSLGLYVTNLNPSQAQNNPPATSYSVIANELYPSASPVYSINSSFNAGTEDVITLNPSSQYTLSAGPYDSLAINSTATINVPNALTTNDTISRTQILSNTLAYDDGSVERAFGLTNLGLKKFGYEFNLHEKDTIIGFQVLFTNIDVNVHDLVFVYDVWSHLQLGNFLFVDTPIYSSLNQVPLYVDTVSGYATYVIPPLAVDTHFYFGWSQTDNRNLQVGYDLNSAKGYEHMFVYTNANGEWRQVHLTTVGSPMIRLLMRHSSQYGTGVKDITAAGIKAYPNPTTGLIRFELPEGEDNYQVELYNSVGQLCLRQSLEQASIDIRHLTPGMYLLRLTDTKTGMTYQNKILRSAND